MAAVLVAGALGVGSCGQSPHTPPAASNSPPAAAQTYTLGADAEHPEVSVRLSADRSRMTLAERLTLKLTIDAADGSSVLWTPPDPPEGRLGDFTVAASVVRSLPAPPGRTVTERTIVLEPFLDGRKSIPAITLDVRSADGATPTRAITTQPIEVAVAPVIPPAQVEKAALAPAHAPLQPTLPTAHGRPWIAALAVAGLLAWVGAFAWARFVAPRRNAVLSPLADTRARLADIRRRLAAAQVAPFDPGVPATPAIAADLAGTLRAYLDRHLHLTAAAATASELRPRLEQGSVIPAPLGSETAEAIVALERYAFSPTQPRCADLLPLLETAERLVAATAGAPTQQAEAAA